MPSVSSTESGTLCAVLGDTCRRGVATAPTAFLVPTAAYICLYQLDARLAAGDAMLGLHFNADDIDFLMQHPESVALPTRWMMDGALVTRSSWRRPLVTVTLKTSATYPQFRHPR